MIEVNSIAFLKDGNEGDTKGKKAKNTIPIAASSLMGERILIKAMAIVLKIPAINAPTKILAPIMNLTLILVIRND